jgi:hypothetical protein
LSKIQVRRGTASQWTAANTLLSSGEIGFETDTGKFKIGNGSSVWDSLDYFLDSYDLSAYLTTASASTTYLTQSSASTTYATKTYADSAASSASAAAVSFLVDSAPETLDTLNELAAALGDDANFASTVSTSLANKLDASSASTTYLTQASFSSASLNFATDAELASAIVTASAAAVAYADGLTTADVAENTNLYFTNERAVNAGSATYILQTSQQGIINSASAAAVTAVLDSAPETLDTLNELAAALGDDANFASTVAASLANKLDASSASTIYQVQVANVSDTEIGYLDGVTSGIQSQIDSKLAASSASTTYLTQTSASTTYATQAYVDEATSSLINITEVSGTSYTLQLSDNNTVIEMNNASANTITIPLNSSVAFPIGSSIDIFQTGVGQTTITPAEGVTIKSSNSETKLTGQYSGSTIYKRATNEWALFGDLSA